MISEGPSNNWNIDAEHSALPTVILYKTLFFNNILMVVYNYLRLLLLTFNMQRQTRWASL